MINQLARAIAYLPTHSLLISTQHLPLSLVMRLDICIDYLHHAVRSPPTSALYISEKSAPQKIFLQISNSKFARK